MGEALRFAAPPQGEQGVMESKPQSADLECRICILSRPPPMPPAPVQNRPKMHANSDPQKNADFCQKLAKREANGDPKIQKNPQKP